jgi:hypothetical protein
MLVVDRYCRISTEDSRDDDDREFMDKYASPIKTLLEGKEGGFDPRDVVSGRIGAIFLVPSYQGKRVVCQRQGSDLRD